MDNRKLLEAVADISYIAGCNQYYSGNSRIDISDYINWAKDFELLHKDNNWDFEDYMLALEKFANEKLAQVFS